MKRIRIITKFLAPAIVRCQNALICSSEHWYKVGQFTDLTHGKNADILKLVVIQ